MSQPQRGLLPQRFSYDENEVGSPGVMMTSTAVPTAHGLAQFIPRPIIRGHDMRQLMKTSLFTLTDAQPVVRADLYPALISISVADPPATDNGYRVRIRREGTVEPLHLLDGVNVTCTMPIIYYPIILHKHRAS
jgi:hypothetical protein